MKALVIYNKVQKLREKQDEVPFSVKRMFREAYFEIDIVGDQISFGEDYVSLEYARENFEWVIDQLGGKITWG